MKRILVTGGAGFVAHHFIEHVLKSTDWQIITLDRLDVSGNLNRLASIEGWDQYKTRVKTVFHDLKAPINDSIKKSIGEVNYIFHFAAGSHVDRSIDDPMSFVMDNVVGTGNVLDYARNLSSLEKMIYFSTDEVFGPAPDGVDYKEWDRYNSGNPYSASKAGAEELCLAFANTYKIPVLISHCMNIFGERQHPEKFIPMTIKKILNGETVTIHANKDKTRAGSRFYIHARNVAAATMFLLENGETVDGSGLKGKYNIRGERELDNLTLAQMIANILGKELKYEMVDFHSSRPGHDLRYALDGSLMESMGWNLPVNLEDSLRKVVEWSLQHPEWL